MTKSSEARHTSSCESTPLPEDAARSMPCVRTLKRSVQGRMPGGVAQGGDRNGPGVLDLANEVGDRHGGDTRDASTPGTKAQPGRSQGNRITDHQGATKLVGN